MHASRLFKCFFFFPSFFSSDGIEKFRPWKNSYRSAMSFQFFQHSEISGLRGTRYTRASCDKWLFFPSHWFFFSFFSYETYLVKYSSSALRILYQASTYQCESCPEVWTLMHRHYFVSLYIPLISFIRENFWQSYELNDLFFFERLDVEG